MSEFLIMIVYSFFSLILVFLGIILAIVLAIKKKWKFCIPIMGVLLIFGLFNMFYVIAWSTEDQRNKNKEEGKLYGWQIEDEETCIAHKYTWKCVNDESYCYCQ